MPPEKSSHRSRPSTHRGTAAVTVISVYTVIVAGVLWWFEGIPTMARIPLALPILLFTPGYAVITALFPPSGSGALDSRLERGILAIAASIGIVPMIALATTVTGRIELHLILASIAAITILASAVAIVRELVGETAVHGSTPPRESSNGNSSVRHAATDGITIVAIAITALLLIASAAVAYTDDGGNQLMTEFYVANENETGDDSRVAYDLQINHHGTESQQYTLVVLLEPNESTAESSQSWSELERSATVVEPDETAAITYAVDRSDLDTDSTVRFLLYTDEAPSTPDPDAAHRVLAFSVETTAE